MKNRFLFLAALLFVSINCSINGMENEQAKIEEPFFNAKKQEYYVLAQSKEKEVGSATYYPYRESNTWYLSILEVDPEYQKKGIASQLLRACITHAQAMRARSLEWQVLPRNIDMNKPQLIAIYRKMLAKIDPGFAQTVTEEERGDEYLSRTFMVLKFY
jgi:ribosomal protein S18 acetylase RimI-like enzyme